MCTLDFCDQAGRNKDGAGPCEAHYYQQRRGRPFTPVQPKTARAGDPCAADECDKVKGDGPYCVMHTARIARHGDPGKVIAPQERKMPRGTSNPMWSSDPGYFTVHGRLSRTLGRARDRACADCGKRAAQWSYIGPREPGERLPFSPDLSQYAPRCVPCHKSADLASM